MCRGLKDADKFRGEIFTPRIWTQADFTAERRAGGKRSTAICCAPSCRGCRSRWFCCKGPSYIYEMANRAGPLVVLCQALPLGIRFPVNWLRHYLQLQNDVIFVGFRKFPRLARWFFRSHWLKAVGRDAFRRALQPRYTPGSSASPWRSVEGKAAQGHGG